MASVNQPVAETAPAGEPSAPSATETLQFESGHALRGLFSEDERLLRRVEAALNVKLTARDTWLRIDGEPLGVEKAAHIFLKLDKIRREGIAISRHDFLYALRAVTGERSDELDELHEGGIYCSPRKPPIVPRTKSQRDYLRAIRERDLVFGIGPAGTGKTYLAMAAAVESLKQNRVARIILTRPAVEAGEALGFLPGALEDKILPYLRPLYDALYDMLEAGEIQKYMDRGVVEIAPLAYMRGRTLNHAFVILDEAQNTTAEQMFMFLTRLGAESKCVVTGDRTQIDLPNPRRSGLLEATAALREVENISFLEFANEDVIRHELVQQIIKAYQHHRDPQGAAAPRKA